MTNTETLPVAQLPEPVRSYLTAHAVRDVDAALAAFAPDAEVVDDGHVFRGTAAVRDCLATAGAQYRYTTEHLGGEQVDGAVWLAHVRIEGDFPGGRADLTYRFVLAEGLITRLDITA